MVEPHTLHTIGDVNRRKAIGLANAYAPHCIEFLHRVVCGEERADTDDRISAASAILGCAVDWEE